MNNEDDKNTKKITFTHEEKSYIVKDVGLKLAKIFQNNYSVEIGSRMITLKPLKDLNDCENKNTDEEDFI